MVKIYIAVLPAFACCYALTLVADNLKKVKKIVLKKVALMARKLLFQLTAPLNFFHLYVISNLTCLGINPFSSCFVQAFVEFSSEHLHPHDGENEPKY